MNTSTFPLCIYFFSSFLIAASKKFSFFGILELWQMLSKAIEKAAEGFVEARVKEGGNLREDLLDKLEIQFLRHLDIHIQISVIDGFYLYCNLTFSFNKLAPAI